MNILQPVVKHFAELGNVSTLRLATAVSCVVGAVPSFKRSVPLKRCSDCRVVVLHIDVMRGRAREAYEVDAAGRRAAGANAVNMEGDGVRL